MFININCAISKRVGVELAGVKKDALIVIIRFIVKSGPVTELGYTHVLKNMAVQGLKRESNP